MRSHKPVAESTMQRHSCSRKARFRRRRDALRRADDIARDGGIRLVPYHCSYCGSWHLHSDDRTPRRRVDNYG